MKKLLCISLLLVLTISSGLMGNIKKAQAEWRFDTSPPNVSVMVNATKTNGTTNPWNNELEFRLNATDNIGLPGENGYTGTPTIFINLSTDNSLASLNPITWGRTIPDCLPTTTPKVSGSSQLCKVSGIEFAKQQKAITLFHDKNLSVAAYYITAKVQYDAAGNGGYWSAPVAFNVPPAPTIAAQASANGSYTTTISWNRTNWYNPVTAPNVNYTQNIWYVDTSSSNSFSTYYHSSLVKSALSISSSALKLYTGGADGDPLAMETNRNYYARLYNGFQGPVSAPALTPELLTVTSCESSNTPIPPNTPIIWRSLVSGGCNSKDCPTPYYTFNWTGTPVNVTGSSPNSDSVTYPDSSSGQTASATLTVTSGTQTKSCNPSTTVNRIPFLNTTGDVHSNQQINVPGAR